MTAGTMTLNGEIYPLGDLAQLTSAANCDLPAQVGTVVCDPWSRTLNQNSDVVEIFRLLGLTNLPIVGTLIFLLFMTVVAISLASRGQTSAVPTLIFLFSPSILLAIERGNELLTLSLLMVGFQLMFRRIFLLRYLGIFLLFLASIFKLWPTFVIIGLAILFRRKISVFEKTLLMFPALYWLFNSNEAIRMLSSTQQGSLFGNSFGLKLWFSSGPTVPLLLVLFFFLLIFSYTIFKLMRAADYVQPFIFEVVDSKLLVVYSLNYFVLWAFGDSFAYRLVALIPIFLILSKSQYRDSKIGRILLVLILTTAFTIRLSITPAVSASLALTLLLFAGHLMRNPMVRK